MINLNLQIKNYIPINKLLNTYYDYIVANDNILNGTNKDFIINNVDEIKNYDIEIIFNQVQNNNDHIINENNINEIINIVIDKYIEKYENINNNDNIIINKNSIDVDDFHKKLIDGISLVNSLYYTKVKNTIIEVQINFLFDLADSFLNSKETKYDLALDKLTDLRIQGALEFNVLYSKYDKLINNNLED